MEATIETETNLTEVPIVQNPEWMIVSDSYRTVSRVKFQNNELTQALKEGKTLKITHKPLVDRLYRWANANHYSLHRRHIEDFHIVWAELNVEIVDDGEDVSTPNE